MVTRQGLVPFLEPEPGVLPGKVRALGGGDGHQEHQTLDCSWSLPGLQERGAQLPGGQKEGLMHTAGQGISQAPSASPVLSAVQLAECH